MMGRNMASDDDKLREWVETWAKAGPRLEALKRAELRNFNHADHAAEIDALLEIACQHISPQPTSGLVEQQRLFGKLPR